jgi:transglutaminase-like putative cysteine protease
MPTNPTTKLLTLLLLLLTPLATAAHTDSQPLDRWYILTMSGQRAGWMHATRTIDGDEITTASRTELTIKRGELELNMAMSTEFRETAGGIPIEMSQTTNFGGAPSTVRYVFKDSHIQQLQGERVTRLDLPEGKWLPPAAAAEFTKKRLEAGATEITLRTIDPSSGVTPIVIERRDLEPATIDTPAGPVEGLRSTTVASNYPQLESTEYIDTDGILLRSTLDLGMFKIDVTAADRATALAENADAPELMTSLFITPSKPIDNPRRTTKATYILSVPDGTLPDIPTAANQRAERLDDRTARVTVDTTIPAVPFAEKISLDPFLASTAVLRCDDPEVLRLTESALATQQTAKPNASQAGRAEALRRAVHAHITSKDLTVGFANAAEVARSGEGDCTEHAVLLAAMLRAANIPSRVASGLIYADQFAGSENIFGYHMWTQALLTGKDGLPQWVDLDATLPAWLPFDATHIALSTSPLTDDNAIGGLVELAPLMGRLAIQVDSIE